MAQESDIPSRIKEDSEIFGESLFSSFNDVIDKFFLLTALKQANITPVFKTWERCSKDNYKLVCILPNVSKILENVCFVKCLIIWINSYPNTRAVSEKDAIHNIVF